MNGQTFVFFGIVGSGKGTQVKLLQEFLKNKDGKECLYAYPGNEYRKITESKTQTSDLVNDTIHHGHLQPDFLTNAIFVKSLMNDISADKHVIIDGYPRTLVQSECLDEVMDFYGRKNIKLVYLEVSREEVMKRLKLRGRQDDTDIGISQRFNEYVNNVVPAMNYFKDNPKYEIITIHGEKAPEEVHKDIIKALGL